MKYLISFTIASIILCYCAPKRTAETPPAVIDSPYVHIDSSVIAKPPLTLTSVDSKVTLLQDQFTIYKKNSDAAVKKLNDSMTIVLKAKTAQAAQLKSVTDSLNSYKKWADGSIFKATNGVLTLPYFLEMKNYLIKIGAIKP